MVRWFKSAIRPSLAIDIPFSLATSLTRKRSMCVLSLLCFRGIVTFLLTYVHPHCMLCSEYILLIAAYTLTLTERGHKHVRRNHHSTPAYAGPSTSTRGHGH